MASLLGVAAGFIGPIVWFVQAVRATGDPGGPLFLPAAIIVGVGIGATVVPVIVLILYWLFWRLAGRP